MALENMVMTGVIGLMGVLVNDSPFGEVHGPGGQPIPVAG
jgi:hypothetical protein